MNIYIERVKESDYGGGRIVEDVGRERAEEPDAVGTDHLGENPDRRKEKVEF